MRLRPAKCAILFDGNDIDWQNAVIRIIEWCSLYWSGNMFLIIPTSRSSIKNEYWRILEEYGPDYLFLYQKTYNDIKRGNKEIYDHLREELFGKIRLQFPSRSHEDIEKTLDERFKNNLTIAEKFEITEELKIKLAKRLNPFFNREDIFHRMHRDGDMQNILTSINAIIPERSNNERKVYDLKFDKSFIEEELLFRNHIGSSHLFNSNNSRRRKRTHSENSPAYELEIEDYSNNPKLNLFNFFSTRIEMRFVPFSYISHGLERSFDFNNNYKDQKVTVVIGSSLDDYLFFYNLSRITEHVYYIPCKILEGPSNLDKDEYISNLFYSIEHDFTTNLIDFRNGISFTSFSLESSVIKDYVNRLKKIAFDEHFSDGNIDFNILDPSEILLSLYIIIHQFEKDSLITYIQHFINNQSINSINSLKPHIFKDLELIKHKWLVDINISPSPTIEGMGYSLPTARYLTKDFFTHIVNGHNMAENAVRNYKHTFSYDPTALNFIYDSGRLDNQMIKPVLQLKSDFEIFKTIFQHHKYSISLSDKGKYMQAAINFFGSLEKLAEVLKNKAITAIFDAFVLEKGKEEINYGFEIDKIIYLNYEDLHNLCGNESIRNIVDSFLKVQLLNRGLLLKCERCMQLTWYRLGEITDEFNCKRCLHTQIITSAHWKSKSNEPPIYYKLDEMFRLAYKFNMTIPVLALDKLRRMSNVSFMYTPEIVVQNSDDCSSKFEFDIVCISDGKIYWGEAKSSNEKFSKEEKAQLWNYNKILSTLDGCFVFACNTLNETNSSFINKLKWNSSPLLFQANDLYN